MLISHKSHTDNIQVYSVTVMTHVKALQAGHSSQGTSEPITPAPPTPVEPTGLEALLQTYFTGQQSPGLGPRFRQLRRNWAEVKCFSCGKTGHSANRCPKLDVTFPFILPGWKSEKTPNGYLMISPKMAMDRRRAENED